MTDIGLKIDDIANTVWDKVCIPFCFLKDKLCAIFDYFRKCRNMK